MEVYKFGGASVKDAAGIRNVGNIIRLNAEKDLLIVVSAMGKTTNALEALTESYINGENSTHSLFEEIRQYHHSVLAELFEDESHPAFDEIENTFIEIEWMLEDDPHPGYDFNYDQIVSIGELLSSRILSAWLNHVGFKNKWLDARGVIQTDNTYREGQVDWTKTCKAIEVMAPILKDQFIVTQGFIGGTSENFSTTLGREGSDYSAAIFASCLNAEKLTIWKDVPGVLSADPKLFSDTRKYSELPYSEAMEMTYYGATVIHPKTIKPLQNSGIPLLVKPFLNPEEEGTIINETAAVCKDFPAIIVKQHQVLASISTKELLFITEDHLSEIFKAFAMAHIKINLMQVSALSFTVCFDEEKEKFNALIVALNNSFKIKYNQDLQLITIRHYKPDTIDQLSSGKIVLMEQLSRNTAQLVLK
ncbi:aspartate kinase [Flavihumibacter sp. R14]|nr:aspartate kinase [Flavihumibacter soli]